MNLKGEGNGSCIYGRWGGDAVLEAKNLERRKRKKDQEQDPSVVPRVGNRKN
jgi:hypothetical protein